MTHQAVSTPLNLSTGVSGTSGRPPAAPLTLNQAYERLKAATSVEEMHAAIVECVNAIHRSPTVAGAIALTRMARHIGSEEWSAWIDKEVDVVATEAQRSLVEETVRQASAEFTRQAEEMMRRELGEIRMREIDAFSKDGKLKSAGGKA